MVKRLKKALLLVAAVGVASIAYPDQLQPREGSPVTVSLNKFHQQDFTAATHLVTHDLRLALGATDSAQLTFWLTNSATQELVSVSFFATPEDVNALQKDQSLDDIFDKLAPLRNGPEAKFRSTAVLVPNTTQLENYQPSRGDTAVIHVNKFTAETYDSGMAILLGDYAMSLNESSEAVLTYWLANPETYEIVDVSVFAADIGSDSVLAASQRSEALQPLEPLRRAPQIRLQYQFVTS
ncbi:MAG: hypothetical protein AAGI44_09295 [Pseudomonadota bacterium]